MNNYQILLAYLENNSEYSLTKIKELLGEDDDNYILGTFFSALGNAIEKISDDTLVDECQYIFDSCNLVNDLIKTGENLDDRAITNGIGFCERRISRVLKQLKNGEIRLLVKSIKHEISNMVITNKKRIDAERSQEDYQFVHHLIFKDRNWGVLKEVLSNFPYLINVRKNKHSLLDDVIDTYRRLIKQPYNEDNYIYFENILKLIYYSNKFIYSEEERERHLKKLKQMIESTKNQPCIVSKLERVRDILRDQKHEHRYDGESIIEDNITDGMLYEIAYIKKNDIIDDPGRVDLTRIPVFTIDSGNSKILDDGLSLEIIPEGYRLGIHIADVCHFVKEGSLIDCEAYNRGITFYLQDKIMPMIPYELGMELCSLLPYEKRKVISCFVILDKNGNRLGYSFQRSTIVSKQKINCNEVGKIINNGCNDEKLQQTLKLLYELSDMEADKIKSDDEGEAITGSSLLAPFMIMANQIAANHFDQHQWPFIFRVMSKPDDEALGKKLYYLDRMLEETVISREEYKKILSIIQSNKPQGEYAIKNISHYALGYDSYGRWTSPLRNYNDLTNQRLIDTFILQSLTDEQRERLIDIWSHKLPAIVEHINKVERKYENGRRAKCKVLLR